MIGNEDERKVNLEDFELLRVLGKGGFGKVLQVAKKDDGKVYALKVLDKEAVISREQVEHTRMEVQILQKLRHPFLNRIHFAYQDAIRLYMVLTYLPGGDLFYRLKQEGQFSVARTRQYAAEVACALGHLHGLDIIHRDLKPENLLFDEAGHLCLTDFGFATVLGVSGEAYTFCGTPEYLAPEMLLTRRDGGGYDAAVDWWALGTLVYEMLCGTPPFYSPDHSRMYERILHEPLVVPCHEAAEAPGRAWTDAFDPDAAGLITSLLERDPTERLGSWPGDVADVERHSFFLRAHVSFERVARGEYAPLHTPAVAGSDDVSNFDPTFTSMEPTLDISAADIIEATLRMRCDASGAAHAIFWRAPDGGADGPRRNSITVETLYVSPSRREALARMGEQRSFAEVSREFTLDPSGDGPVATAIKTRRPVFVQVDSDEMPLRRKALAQSLGVKKLCFLPVEGGVIELGTTSDGCEAEWHGLVDSTGKGVADAIAVSTLGRSSMHVVKAVEKNRFSRFTFWEPGGAARSSGGGQPSPLAGLWRGLLGVVCICFIDL